ncbi:MAG: MarR family transcriptional regulator [Rhodopila sp.]|nr:MarR family transcriptional regulator [Rhodopila sp.]
MNKQHVGKPTSGPPAAVMGEIRGRLPEGEWQWLQALFALRSTVQQVDNAVSEWMAATVGSIARYQILMALWAARADGIPHSEIVARMGVTRATVSGLMSALEREGYLNSTVDCGDRRKLIARLTAKGEAAIKKAFETNAARFREVACLTPSELATLTALLHRIREGFAKPR